MPQKQRLFETATNQSMNATPSRSRNDEKWPPLATLLFVVVVSLAGWTAALYPIFR